MISLISWWEKLKKYKHGKNCHKEQKHFSPFVLSIDGIFGEEAKFLLNYVSQIMAKKLEQWVSHVCGWINRQIYIAVVQSQACMLHSTRLTIPLGERDNQWESDSSLGLEQ